MFLPNYISNRFALSLFLSLGSERLTRKRSGLTYWLGVIGIGVYFTKLAENSKDKNPQAAGWKEGALPPFYLLSSRLAMGRWRLHGRAGGRKNLAMWW